MHLPAQDSELMPKHDDLQLLEPTERRRRSTSCSRQRKAR